MEPTIILGIILLICVVLLVTGLRMLVIVTREAGETSAMVKATLDAVSKLLREK